MNIDWNLVFSGISAIATCLGVIAAWFALHSWKKQKKANVAEEIILCAIELEEIINCARKTSNYDEGKSRFTVKKENEDEKSTKDAYYVCVERINNNISHLVHAQSIKIKAELHFVGIEEKIDFLISSIKKIQSASYMLISTYRNRDQIISPKQQEQDRERKEKWENTIWNQTEEDEFSKKVSETVNEIKSELKRYLK